MIKGESEKKMRDTYLRLIPWPAMDVRIILDACVFLYLFYSLTLSIYLFESNLVALNSPDNHNKIIGYGVILQFIHTHTHIHTYTCIYMYFI
jgi:hypothetical protein